VGSAGSFVGVVRKGQASGGAHANMSMVMRSVSRREGGRGPASSLDATGALWPCAWVMGLMRSRWEADYEGHRLTVSRNELTRGFALECDGRVVAQKRFSLLGIGELHGTLPLGDHALPFSVALDIPSSCSITVAGRPLSVRKVE
jgi:hypothetical protein